MLKNIVLPIILTSFTYSVACESPKHELTPERLAILIANRKELERISAQYKDDIIKHEGEDNAALYHLSPEKPSKPKQARNKKNTAAKKLNF